MIRLASVVGWCGLLLLIATGTTAKAESTFWIRGVYTRESPRPQLSSEDKAWQRAIMLAESTPDAFVLVGTGSSMQPLYDTETILVLRQLPFRELQRGQTVLYRNKRGKIVAHVLVSRTRDGWRARGLNNHTHDMEPVQAENLVGIVLAAFKPVSPGVPGKYHTAEASADRYSSK
jgi:signal peptidase I